MITNTEFERKAKEVIGKSMWKERGIDSLFENGKISETFKNYLEEFSYFNMCNELAKLSIELGRDTVEKYLSDSRRSLERINNVLNEYPNTEKHNRLYDLAEKQFRKCSEEIMERLKHESEVEHNN